MLADRGGGSVCIAPSLISIPESAELDRAHPTGTIHHMRSTTEQLEERTEEPDEKPRQLICARCREEVVLLTSLGICLKCQLETPARNRGSFRVA